MDVSNCAERLVMRCGRHWILTVRPADELAPKINNSLYSRQSYGALITYYVWKKDTTAINHIIAKSEHHTSLDENWQYLYYLAGRFFLFSGEQELASVYAKKSIDVHLQHPLMTERLAEVITWLASMIKAKVIYESTYKKILKNRW
jgi:hypothetical protein